MTRDEFLEGLRLEPSPEIAAWIEEQRRRLAGMRTDAVRASRARGRGVPAPLAVAAPRGQRLPRLRVFYVLGAAAVAATTFASASLWDRERSAEPVVAVSGDASRVSAPPRPRVARETTASSAARDVFDHAAVPARFRNDSVARASLDLFRRAVQLDPDFAGAHAHLSMMFVRIAPANHPTMPRAQRIDSAMHHAMRAVALDDSLAEAHNLLGAVRFNAYEFRDAEASFRRALELNPAYASPRRWISQIHVFAGRFDEALEEALRAWQTEPASSDGIVEVARGYLLTGRCDDALAWLSRLEGVQPPVLWARSIESECMVEKGRWDEAFEVLREGLPAAGVQMLGSLGQTLGRAARVGPVAERRFREEESRTILRTVLAHAGRGEATAFDVASVYAGLGELDAAFEWLEKALQERSLILSVMHPRYEELHGDPRFNELIARLGLPGR
jgi:tetratricopeptide (TPR) repeat protein